MRQSHHKSLLSGTSADRSAWRVVAITLVVANLVLIAKVMTADTRTYITPPSIEKGFWISGRDASPEYLEQMALWFTQLALTLTPSSMQYQHEVLLRYIAPELHGEIKTRAAVNAERVRRDDISQVFYVSSYRIDAPKMRVALTGTLQRWVGATPVEPEQRTYRIAFRMNAGSIIVSEFKEADPNDPFNPKADKADRDAAVGAVVW